MTYSSIATVIHDPEATNAHLDMAIALAEKYDAHLHVLVAGIDHTDPGFYYAGAQAVATHQNLGVAQHDADALDKLARTKLAQQSIAWDVQRLLIMLPGLSPFLADTMRFHDLVVMPSPYQGSAAHIDEAIFEACLFRAGCPVMICPPKPLSLAFNNVMVAWDDSAQALAAAKAAMPAISDAGKATVIMIDPPTEGPDRSDPGGQMASFIAHRGASVEILVQSRRLPNIALQLLQTAHEGDNDLIVMGAYGHSRLRESILGGATRDMLKQLDIPVLMAR